jgi:hypothetical protein
MSISGTYYLHQSIKDQLLNQNFPYNDSIIAKTFNDMNNAGDYFSWIQGVLIPTLFREDLYNGDPVTPRERRYLTTANRLVGSMRVRQIRSSINKKDQCLKVNRFNPDLAEFDTTCYPRTKPWSRDPFPASSTKQWKWQNCDGIGGGSLYIGKYLNVPCEGYSVTIPFHVSLQNASDTLAEMRSNRWIDKQTRAIVQEFFTYNSNLYSFTSTKLIVEFTNGGALIPTYELRSFRLYPMNTPRDIVLMVFGMFTVLYLAYQVLNLVNKVGRSVCYDLGIKLPSVKTILSFNTRQGIRKTMMDLDDLSGDDEEEQLHQKSLSSPERRRLSGVNSRSRRSSGIGGSSSYFAQRDNGDTIIGNTIDRISVWTWHKHFFSIWNWLDIALILLGLMSFILRMMSYCAPSRRSFDITLSSYPSQLEYFLLLYKLDSTVCCIFIIVSFFKVFKYFSLNDRFNLLALTMARAWEGLLVVGLTMIICLLAFAFAGYINFGYDFSTYRTFIISFSTLLRTLLGDFRYEEMRDENRRLFPWHFIAFMIVGFLVIMNMFLAVVNEAFSESSKKTLDNDLGYQPKKIWQDILRRLQKTSVSYRDHTVTLNNNATNYFNQGDEEIITRLKRYSRQTGKTNLTMDDIRNSLGTNADPAIVGRIMTRFDDDKSGAVDIGELEQNLTSMLLERKKLAAKAGKQTVQQIASQQSNATVKAASRERNMTPPQQIVEIDDYLSGVLDALSRLEKQQLQQPQK